MAVDLSKEITDLILTNLRKTVPAAIKDFSRSAQLLDRSTNVMGITKILKKGFTP